MAVLVYAESWSGRFRKSTFEVVSYASETARVLGTSLSAVSFDNVTDDELIKLGSYGVAQVFNVSSVTKSDDQAVSKVIADLSQEISVIILSNSYTSKMISPRLAVKLEAAFISNVVSLTETPAINVTKQSFSSKALEQVESRTNRTILSISSNSFGLVENLVDCSIEQVNSNEKGVLQIEGQEIANEKISLSEAEIVISAGRGLKGPENWSMIEELAQLIGGATACSKPVSDSGWRPHSEHVGQTGKVVSPNLYIAIGISGAIQHLAGVNSSKVMVVINTDPEAPFFKSADYGIVGDAFEVVPKLIDEIRKFKQ